MRDFLPISSSLSRGRWMAIGAAAAIGLLAWAYIVNHVLTKSDRTRIEETIEAVAGDDPRVCRTKMTVGYLEQRTGVRGPAADEVCEEEQATDSHEVAIEEISIDDDTATAVVTEKGGSFNGSSGELELVRRQGSWRIDRLIGFRHLDRRRFDLAYRRLLAEYGLSRTQVDCVLTRSRRLSDAALERAYVEEGGLPLLHFAVACDRAAIERRLLNSAEDSAYDLDAEAVACVERRLRRRDDADLAALYERPIAFAGLVYGCGGDATFDHFERELEHAAGSDPATVACVVDGLRTASPLGAARLTYDQEAYAELVERCEFRSSA